MFELGSPTSKMSLTRFSHSYASRPACNCKNFFQVFKSRWPAKRCVIMASGRNSSASSLRFLRSAAAIASLRAGLKGGPLYGDCWLFLRSFGSGHHFDVLDDDALLRHALLPHRSHLR